MKPSSIVITGMAGKFPEARDVREFADKLYAKTNLVSGATRRFPRFHPELPERTGHLRDIERFDVGFFGASARSADYLDPGTRIVLENVHEAVLDAGRNPRDLRGARVGVFVATCASETEIFSTRSMVTGCDLLARCTRYAVSKNIAYYFELNSVALMTDTACSSSFYALDTAYQHFNRGLIDKAIVCAMNFCLNPFSTLQFVRLGVLSQDGSCKSFDDSGNGYVRSEGVVAILLERRDDAKRIYAELIHSKTNCDGYKEEGITFPSSEMQKVLLKDFYQECNFDPKSITFVEAHGTGTVVGDPQELETLDEIFCTGRSKPLLIGAVKSSIGHNEPVSGLCSIIKVLIGFENGLIPPNINYKTPRKGIEALEKGRLKVVSEVTKWPENDVYVAINSFGFGGANGHVLLHWHTKSKTIQKLKNVPLLVCASGRTEEAVWSILGGVEDGFDQEFVKLLYGIYAKPIENNLFNGYKIWIDGVEVGKGLVKKGVGVKKLCLVVGEIPKETSKIVERNLEAIPGALEIFKEVKKISSVPNGIQNHLVTLVLIQIIKNLKIPQEIRIIGPKIFVAFFKGNLTLSQTISTLAKTDFLPPTKISPQDPNTLSLIIGNYTGEIETPNIQLINPNEPDGVLVQFFESLGKLYLEGFTMSLDGVYGKFDFPVSRGTKMVSPLIKWNHSKKYYIYKFNLGIHRQISGSLINVNPKEPDWSYITGHVIDGRVLFPATGYLFLAWNILCNTVSKILEETVAVFEDVKFLRAATVPSDGTLTLKATFSLRTNTFAIFEDDALLVTGKMYESEGEVLKRKRFFAEESKTFMDQKDVYKELRLRGYNYRNDFRAIEKYGTNGKTATISWTENWTTFMDNMLQLYILQEDNRSLYVPTNIKRLTVDPKKQETIALRCKNEIPVYIFKEANLISGGGVEITGMGASEISRRKAAEPVLETYKFIPNRTTLPHDQAVRCMTQIVMENTNSIKVKAVEIASEIDSHDPIMPLIQQTLEQLPLIQSDLKILTKLKDFEFNGIAIGDVREFNVESDDALIVIIKNQQLIEEALGDFENYVIVKEIDGELKNSKIHVVCSYETEKGKLVLIKRSPNKSDDEMISVDVSSIEDFAWVDTLKKSMDKKVVIYSQKSPLNGLLGLINCLRREPSGTNIFAMIIMDDNAPEFDINNDFYKSQLVKNQAINIFKDNQWGTYRHLLLTESESIEKEHLYCNVTTKGDLSSLRWIEGSLSSNTKTEPENDLINVHYSALNFRDIMTASGRLPVNAITKDRILQECIQGFEFSGVLNKDKSKRVMGMNVSGALSTMVLGDKQFLWEIPSNWSLEEAATVPVVYGTVLYSLVMRGRIKAGQSILIHSGTGGVGQAAINIASYLNCEIFVTVGTEEKREFIKKHFPQIKPEHIGDSRSTSFEQMIFKHTNGRGVDFVLNSLAEEKLLASVRCLAYNGVFMEIGKFDLAADSQIGTALLKKQARIEGMMLDQLFTTSHKHKGELVNLMRKFMENDTIKPLIRTVFPMRKVEEAYRFMTSGKHIGKILVKIQGDAPNGFEGLPRLWCHQDKSYIILGGLGGFGLELVDWLVTRGAKHLILTSRNGIKNGYQAYRLKIFESYGARVSIRNDDISTENGCKHLLGFAESFAPVDGIFNLAVVLKDALFENQTRESFQTSFAPKAYATQYLDRLSRKICPSLRYFVVFSSVSCGRGNPGQTNYGAANSIMERICEQRKKDGYPALAIQWGAVGDVGLVADMQDNNKELVIGGTLQQRITSCLQLLDKFLKQTDPIVASMVVAEKKTSAGGDNVIDAVLNIIGVTNVKSVSFHSTFPELGMDSMMAVEIKQTLEREYEILLSAQDLRNLTLDKLQKMTEPVQPTPEPTKIDETRSKPEQDDEQNQNNSWNDEIPNDIRMIFNQFSDNTIINQKMIHLKASYENSRVAYGFPGIEGMGGVFKQLSEGINNNFTSFQYCPDDYEKTVPILAKEFASEILKSNSDEDFKIVAHSYGCIIALEVMYILEDLGKVGKAIFIDGSPELISNITKSYLPHKNEKMLETSLLYVFMSKFMSFEEALKHKVPIHMQKTYDDKIRYVLNLIPKTHAEDYMIKGWKGVLSKVKWLMGYQPEGKLNSKLLLIKPTKLSLLKTSDDYGLSKISKELVQIKTFEGNHTTILQNPRVSAAINDFFVN